MSFSQNIISYQFIDIQNSKFIEFDNVTCTNLNLDKNKKHDGGCFRFNNILTSHLKYVRIDNSYSYSTTVGIKFIDSINTIEYLSINYNFNNSKQVQNFN